MSWFDDYFHRMSAVRLNDRDIELLLSGEPTMSEDLADLEAFVAAFATESEPPRDTVHMATVLAARARSSTSRPVRSVLRKLVVLGASFAIVVAFSGVALAADGASPGDLLYGVDRALESVGIGAGGIDERIAEFEVLFDRGSPEEAFEFLESEMQAVSPSEAAAAGAHLADVRGETSTGPAESPGLPADSPTAIDEEATVGETIPGSSPSQRGNADSSEDDSLAVAPDDGKIPPGQVKENDNRAEPETAGPKEDGQTASPEESQSPTTDQGTSDPGSNNSHSDSDDNGNADPGTPQGNATGQGDDPEQNQGQGEGQGQGQGQSQGQGQGQSQGQSQGQGQGQGQSQGQSQGQGQGQSQDQD